MKTLKSLVITFAAVALLLAAIPAQAQLKLTETDTTKLFITLHTVGTAQALTHENVYGANGQALTQLSPGFQTAFGDLGFIGKFGRNEEIEVVFDMYLSSRNHPSQTYGNEGYILMRGVPENLESIRFLKPLLDKVDVKAGHFLINFGDGLQRRSNNAIVQKNPLVGNFVIDPNIVSIGMEISNKPSERLNWVIGAFNGTTTEDFNDNRGFGYHGKLSVNPIKSVRTSISYIASDQSGNPPKGQTGGSSTQMFSGNRSGERYAGVLGGGQAPGGIFPQGGEKFSAAQFDITFKNGSPLELYGHYGRTQDLDLNGSLAGAPEEKWAYYAGDVVFRLTKNVYAAARYSAADAESIGGNLSSGKVQRYQAGGGLWLTRNLLMKLEYVDQTYTGFRAGEMVNNNIQAWRNPSFKGLISEVSFSF
ncbi:MAG TPA: hypothetical protein VF057_02105 [Thermoanaerobaculia bacterium]